MHVSEGELKEFITDSGLVAKKEIDDAAEEARKKGVSVGDLLVSRGALTEDALRRIQAYVLGIPFVSLKDFRIDAATLSLIPEPIARAHNAIAYKRDGENLEIALLDIDDLAAVAAVSKRAGLSLKPRLADGESLRGALLQYQQLLKSAFGDIIATEVARLSAPASAEGTLADQELRRAAEDPAAVRIVDALLRHAAAQRASDLHIEPTESDVVVRYRIGGTLRDAMSLPKRAAPAIAARTKALAALKLDERRLPQEGRFKMEAEGAQTAFCVSVLPTAFGEKVVLRLLRAGSEGFTLESIGFHGAGLEQVHRALRATSGLVLIAGPAGSGKTTTLYTLLDVLN
ncbi:MAG: Flp pilus assembly complex ATPase component TadA, partial [Patescibacteria group bacterium]|nr:Flp pilus assembly complex ATPase component TadA [Patescibacteria group bacterium]